MTAAVRRTVLYVRTYEYQKRVIETSSWTTYCRRVTTRQVVESVELAHLLTFRPWLLRQNLARTNIVRCNELPEQSIIVDVLWKI